MLQPSGGSRLQEDGDESAAAIQHLFPGFKRACCTKQDIYALESRAQRGAEEVDSWQHSDLPKTY